MLLEEIGPGIVDFATKFSDSVRISGSVEVARLGGHAFGDIHGGMPTDSTAGTDLFDQMNTFRLTVFFGFL